VREWAGAAGQGIGGRRGGARGTPGVSSPSPGIYVYASSPVPVESVGTPRERERKKRRVQGLVATEGRRNVRRGCHQAGTIHSQAGGKEESSRSTRRIRRGITARSSSS
jgi:hypothetical protein